MPIRSRRIARCQRCGLPAESACICVETALAAPLRLRTRLVLVAHHTEWRRSSNTGRLLASAVDGTRVTLRGDREAAKSQAPLCPNERRLVLFPEEGARDLAWDDAGDDLVESFARPCACANLHRHLVLVVPEGSWGQARRAMRREPWCQDAPRVRLPAIRTSRYRLRHAPHAGELATFEAVAHALEILEGAERVSPLWEIFDRFVERSLALRGRRSEGQAAVEPRR